MDEELEFSTLACCNITMHAMKYPHSVCSGYLLSPSKSQSDDLQAGDRDKTIIYEAIPVSHASQCLAPNLEIAYNAITKYAKSKDLVITGYYQTDRYNQPGHPDSISQRIAEKIMELYPKAILCIVYFEDDQILAKIEPHQFHEGKWKTKSHSLFALEQDTDTVSEHILLSKERFYRRVVDFDDHFDDIKLDWTNPWLEPEIESIRCNL